MGEITAKRLNDEARAVVFVNIARLGRPADPEERPDPFSTDVGVDVLSLEDRLLEVRKRGIVDVEKLERTMYEAHRAAIKTVDWKIHDQLAYRVAAYAALSLNYFADDIVLSGGPGSDYLEFHEVYSQFTFVEKCAFDIALRVIETERGITISLKDRANVVTDFVSCLRESSQGRVYYPEGVGATELADILRELAEPTIQPDVDKKDEPPEPKPTPDHPEPPPPPKRSRWRALIITATAVVVVASLLAAGWGIWRWGLSSGRHDRPPLIDAGPARSGVPLGTNVSIRMLATYKGSDGQPKTVETVSGIAPETPAIVTFPADPETAVLSLQLHLTLTERTEKADPDLKIAFGDNPLLPVGDTYRTDPEHPNGERVPALTVSPEDTHLKLGDTDTVYQFDAALGDPDDYWCGYNTKPMVVYATNGTDPMVVASLPVVVFKDCTSR